MLRIGFVTFPDFGAMGLAAPSTFEHANLGKAERVYEVTLLSETGGLVRSSAGRSGPAAMSAIQSLSGECSPRVFRL